MSVDSTDGEQFSAVYGYCKLDEHTDLTRFDPGGHVSRGFSFDPEGFMKFIKSLIPSHVLF